MRLKDRAAIVTGAGSGIGLAIARRLAAEGARVLIAELNPALGSRAGSAVPGSLFVPTDVSVEDDVRRMAETAADRFGPISVLVNNAGVRMTGNALELTEAEWDRCLDIDLKSAWFCAKHVIPRMKPDGASIINIASMHPFRTQADYLPYVVAKGGMLALTLSLAIDYGPRGIRVNSVCPGLIDTPLAAGVIDSLRASPADYERVLAAHPLGRLGTPEDVACAVAFLASDEASFITGSTLVVDGGRNARAYAV